MKSWKKKQLLKCTALILILFLALAIRFNRIDKLELTNDESFTCRLIGFSLSDLLDSAAADVHPPIFYLLLRFWVTLAGDSIVIIRGFSVFWGLLSIVMAYCVCCEAMLLNGPKNINPSPFCGPALLTAFLLAIHMVQVRASQDARMYSLGIFLCEMSSWFLLRALRSNRFKEGWWTAYGLSIAAFIYCHYYAFFSVFAQVWFFVGYMLAIGWRKGWHNCFAQVANFMFSGMVALVLFLPWFPIFVLQTQSVQQHYWIPEIDGIAVCDAFCSWSLGWSYLGPMESIIAVSVVVAGVSWLVFQGKEMAYFLSLQAFIPWVLSVMVSVFSGRSILFERYFVFSQFYFLALVGSVWIYLPNNLYRVLVSFPLAVVFLCGLGEHISAQKNQSQPLSEMVKFLGDNYCNTDEIWVDHPSFLNKLRYYAKQEGIGPVQVVCPTRIYVSEGHVTHIASLGYRDLVSSINLGDGRKVKRIWFASEQETYHFPPEPNMIMVLRQNFGSPGSARYVLVLYERKVP
jgi:hypothetical protein